MLQNGYFSRTNSRKKHKPETETYYKCFKKVLRKIKVNKKPSS